MPEANTRQTFERCLYFSGETYTSLGYGDIIPHGPLRLLAGMEALNGLLLIGWTASYSYIAMGRFWTDAHTSASIENTYPRCSSEKPETDGGEA